MAFHFCKVPVPSHHESPQSGVPRSLRIEGKVNLHSALSNLCFPKYHSRLTTKLTTKLDAPLSIANWIPDRPKGLCDTRHQLSTCRQLYGVFPIPERELL